MFPSLKFTTSGQGRSDHIVDDVRNPRLLIMPGRWLCSSNPMYIYILQFVYIQIYIYILRMSLNYVDL